MMMSVVAGTTGRNGGGAVVWAPGAIWLLRFRHCRWQVGPARFNYYPKFPKPTKKCKLKIDTFCCSKNSQILYAARLEVSKQLSLLCWLQIPNIIHVKNPGTDSNLNLLWILKEFKPFGKKLISSPKFYLDLIFTIVNLARHTGMRENWVPPQVSTNSVWN
jgi:hypothetical protein